MVYHKEAIVTATCRVNGGVLSAPHSRIPACGRRRTPVTMKTNLKGKKTKPEQTSATLFRTVQESPVSWGCCPVLAHLQCPGRPRFQCSPSRYLRGDRDCSLIFLQNGIWSRESEYERTPAVSIEGGGGRGRTFGVVEMDGSEVAEPHVPVKLVKHGFHPPLCSQVIAYKPTSIHGSFTTTISSTEGINSLHPLQGKH